MQNFISLGCLVLDISTFQYEACQRFRAGASVHKLFVGGVHAKNIISADSSSELSDLHTTQTQATEVTWGARFSSHWVATTMFA